MSRPSVRRHSITDRRGENLQHRLNTGSIPGSTHQRRMPLDEQPFYEFGAYRVDPARGRILRQGSAVPLPPNAFDLLVVFFRSPRRVISKAELMAALWPETFVEDANLTQ